MFDVKGILNSILGGADKLFTSDEERIKAEALLQKEINVVISEQSKIIQKEMNHPKGMWRVRLMNLCMFIIGMQWILWTLVPYIRTTFDLNFWIPNEVPLSPELWGFLKIGVGGYISARTVEKVAAIWKKS